MKNKGHFSISRNIANNLIYAVAIFYTLMNAAAIALIAYDGIAGREELTHLAAYAMGLAGGLWLCFFIPKERKRADAEWKKWEEELETESEEDD